MATIIGTSGDDTLTGTAGADLIEGLGGYDSLVGNGGNDTVSYAGSSGAVSVDLGLGTASDGYGATDSLAGFNNATGSSFDDLIVGNANINVLAGGAGNDTLDGAGGFDTVDYSTVGSGVLVDLGAGIALDGAGGTDNLISIENVVGSYGDDTLIGGAGNNALNGGLGTDTVDYSSAAGAVSINLLAGAASDGGGGTDSLANIENAIGSAYADVITGSNTLNLLSGAAGNDTLSGGNANDTLLGGSENDVLAGGSGADSLDGGSGTDTADYSSGGAITVSLAAGTASDGDTLTGIENVTGSAQADRLTGDANANLLLGGGGDDTLMGNAGDDTLNGGAATTGNVADYGSSTAGVTVNLLAGTASDGFGGTDTLISIQGAYGSAHNDSILGSAGNDTLRGGDGDDTLNGYSGIDTVDYQASTVGVSVNLRTGFASDGFGHTDTLYDIEIAVGSAVDDTLIGGDGDNVLDGRQGSDTVDYSGTTIGGGVSVNLAANIARDNGGATDQLYGIENVVGSIKDDILIGDGGANSLYGGDGDDTLIGRGGNDLLDGGNGVNTLDYSTSTGAVSLNLATGTATDGLGGTDAVSNFKNVIGTNRHDTMVGGAAAESLSGGRGNDLFNGRGGNDTIDGGLGINTIEFADGSGAVSLNLASLSASDGFGGTDRVENIQRAIGWIYDDTFIGSTADEFFDGGSGNDTLSGAGGNDTFVGGMGNDVIDGGSGSNAVDYTTSAYAVTVNLASGTAVDGFGLGHTDTLSNIQVVMGSTHNDSLTGDGNGNVLLGGIGNDTLVGNGGSDVYLLAAGGDQDLIQNGISSNTTASGQLALAADIDPSRVWRVVSGNDMTLQITGTADSVKVQDWYVHVRNQLQSLTLADGSSISGDAVSLLAQIQASYAQAHPGFNPATAAWLPNDAALQAGVQQAWSRTITNNQAGAVLHGTLGNDTLVGSGANTTFIMGAGGGKVQSWQSGDTIVLANVGAAITTPGITGTFYGSSGMTGVYQWTTGAAIYAQGDFNGDGTTDILWRDANANTGVSYMNANGTHSDVSVQTWGLTWNTEAGGTAVGNFVGNATHAGVEILDRESTSAALCLNWPTPGQMSGVYLGQLGMTWQILATGDFVPETSGETRTEILGRLNDGTTCLWWVTPDNQFTGVNLGSTPTTTSILATGNFWGDGRNSMLVKNSADGNLYVWEINTSTSPYQLSGLNYGGYWSANIEFKAAGNFLGTGRSEILVRNTSDGHMYLWTANTNATLSGIDVGTYFPTNNTLQATGNFGGDGKTQMLILDTSNSHVYQWWFENNALTGVDLGTVGQGWGVIATGDYNGDGKTDVLWRNVNTNDTSIWYMNGIHHAGDNLVSGGGTGTALLGNGASYFIQGATPGQVTSSLQYAADYSGATTGVTANLATQTASGGATGSGISLSGVSRLIGSSYGDALTGDSSANTLDGNLGNDTLTGNGGNDTYLFARGGGQDLIQNGSGSASGELHFGPGIATNQLWLRQVSNDLEISVMGSSDKVTVGGWYAGGASKLQEIVIGDGTRLDGQLNTLVSAMASFSAANPGYDPSQPDAAGITDPTLLAAIAAAWHT